MVTFTVEEVLEATDGKLLQGERGILFQGVSTDSRTVRQGDLFIALKGNRFDGHHYALEALGKEAGGILIEERQAKDFRWNGDRSRTVIVVRDTLQALGDLARSKRRSYGPTVVGVTGSNGKTTTKEMIASCLQTTFRVLKTTGNLNNLIGLPLTLLGLTEKERMVVLEMGMNVPGEIRRLTEIAEPDVGIITNIQEVHLEGMGNLEKLALEKGELFRKMRPNGAIVVNRDDARVVMLASDFSGQKITYGIEGPADLRAEKIRLHAGGTSFTLVSEGERSDMTLPVFGKHFVADALAALAVSTLFGINEKKARGALEQFKPYPMRMEVFPLADGKILINDAYNANPRSMELALETLVELKGTGRAIAVVGDMLELGSFAEEAHRRLGRKMAELSIDFVIALGRYGSKVVEAAVRQGLNREWTRVVETHAEALAVLNQIVRAGDRILVKGSRGMAMEKIAENLREEGT
jgi:UDP-N-acetylmuramoyl-tripeptide--D-alanyl-D-alanine ligase